MDTSKIFEAVRSVIPGASKTILYLACAVLLVNANSFPFVWHFKIFRHVWRLQSKYALYRLTLIGKSKSTRKQLKEKYLEGLTPLGADPWTAVVKDTRFAGPDESDYNMHLSNSSYAKGLDELRMQACLKLLPNYFRTGGWMALGGTHFTFHREIPVLSKYEMRTNFGSWDEKWVYIVTRYVTHPKNKKSKSSKDANSGSTAPSLDNAPVPILHTPATGTNTPSIFSNANSPAAVRALAESALRKEEPDGATLHCVSVAELCFKIGRITVPPAIALAMNGFSVASATGALYSHENPPPHWDAVKKLLSSPKETQTFLRGGWRELPAEERWWEQALGGAIEEKRIVTLELLQGVRRGMEGAKAVY